ncbi:hypothetical protein GCM10007922_41570 [Shewanella decolorationis]|nr:hypothetical protein GCM10007922_41570 [Shewanella decolorationis]
MVWVPFYIGIIDAFGRSWAIVYPDWRQSMRLKLTTVFLIKLFKGD